MLLDGALVADGRVARAATQALHAVGTSATELAALAPPAARPVLRERLHAISRSLDPQCYSDPQFVALRLHRMTSGRRRIELPYEHVGAVTLALTTLQPTIVDDAVSVRGFVASRSPVPD
jgi:hypothetical protein